MMTFNFSKSESISLLNIVQDFNNIKKLENMKNIDKYKIYLEMAMSLPKKLVAEIHDLRIRLSSNPYIIISGLPYKIDLPTPISKKFSHEKLDTNILIHAAVCSLFGLIYSFKNKKDLYLIENIFPIERNSNIQINSNSEILNWHVEDGHSMFRADFVGLSCLRGDDSAKTFISCLNDWNLPSDVVSILKDKKFRIKSDTTFSGESTYKDISILSGFGLNEVIYDPEFMYPLDNEAKYAFNELSKEIDRTKKELILHTGDTLIFDNKRLVHGCSKYYPRYDGTDRWLLRSIMLNDLSSAESFMDKDSCTIEGF